MYFLLSISFHVRGTVVGTPALAVATPAISTRRYGPVPRFRKGSQAPANAALVRCKTVHGVGERVKGRVMFGRPGTRSTSAPPHIEPTRVCA